VLPGHEIVLALGLRADGYHQCAALTYLLVKVAPGFQLSDAIRTPAPAKELDHQRAEGEHVRRADEAAGRVVQGKLRSLGAYSQNPLLNPRSKELLDSAFSHRQPLRLHQMPR